MSLTEHLKKLETDRKNAPLQFCQEIPEKPKADDAEFEVQVSVLLSNEEDSSPALTLIRRILRNLIMSPREKKYQTLNLSNAKVQEGLVRIPGAMEFVCLCGFVSTDGQLVYKGTRDMEMPRHGLQVLAVHFPEPTVPSANETSNEALPNPPSDDVPHRERRTQVLLLKPTEVVLPEWFFERTSAELKAEYFTMARKREKDQTFMTREQREQLNRGSTAQHTYAIVRVRLPEGVLLQGEFDAAESIVRIHEWIADQLRDASRPFEVFLPSRERLGVKGTVKRTQLMPATLLSFHWSDGLGIISYEPTIKDELLTTAAVDWELPATSSSK